MNYRATPHSTTNVSPFEALMRRSMKTRLPESFREPFSNQKDRIIKKNDINSK